MRTAVAIAFCIQLATGLVWTLAVAGSPGRGDFALLGLFVVVYGLQLPAALLGLYALWRSAKPRVLAACVASSPVVFWFLPGIVKALAGGHLSQADAAVAGLVILLLATVACFVFPRQVADFLPSVLFRSRVFNGLLLAGPVAGWLGVGAVGLLLAVGGGSGSPGDTGYGLALAITLAAVYLICMGAGSLLVLTWAVLCLRSGIEGGCRKLNVAQLVVSLPAGLLGIGVLWFMAAQSNS